MDKKQLHEAVCQMKAVGLEIRGEINEADCRKRDWYDYWLDKLNKGEVTREWFDKNVWDVYHSDETCTQYLDTLLMFEGWLDKIEENHEKFLQSVKKIDELYNEVKGE